MPGPPPNQRLRQLAGIRRTDTLADRVYKKGPEPPEWLSKEATAVFDAAVRTLESENLVTPSDGPALTLTALAYSLAVVAARELEGDGVTVADSAHGGESRKSPAWQVFREATTIFQKLSAEFGMTPKARQSLPVVVQPDYSGILD